MKLFETHKVGGDGWPSIATTNVNIKTVFIVSTIVSAIMGLSAYVVYRVTKKEKEK